MFYGLTIVMRLLERLRRLSTVSSPEEVAALRAEMQADITAFSATLSGNRVLLEAWRATAKTGGEPPLEVDPQVGGATFIET